MNRCIGYSGVAVRSSANRPAQVVRRTAFTLVELLVVITIIGMLILLLTVGLWTWLVAAAAFLAVAPDFHWIIRYFFYERRGQEPPQSRFGQFHTRIQWCERPWGIAVEVVTFVLGYYLVHRYLL